MLLHDVPQTPADVLSAAAGGTAAGASAEGTPAVDPVAAELMVADVEEPESPAAWTAMLAALERLCMGLHAAVEDGSLPARKVAARFEEDSLQLLLAVVMAAPGVRTPAAL